MPNTPNPNALAAARCTTTQDLLYHGPQHAAHTHLHGSLRDLNTVDKSAQLKNQNGFIGTVLSSFSAAAAPSFLPSHTMSATLKPAEILEEGYEIANLVVVDENFHADATSEADAGSVVDKLKNKFKNFKVDKFSAQPELFNKLAAAQEPKVMLITCIDSRCNPTMLLGLEAGEAFVVRNVANFVHPYDEAGQEVGHENAVGAATQFAVSVMNVEHIVVMGHSSCGGIKALMSRDDFTTDLVGSWVKVGLPAKEKVKALHPDKSYYEQMSFCEKEAVNVSLKNLLTYPYIEERVKDGRLQIHGMHYNLGKGILTSWDIIALPK